MVNAASRHPALSGKRFPDKKANLKGSQGATVITFFQDYGIPAFSTGWGSRGVIHANDEYAEIKTLHNGAGVLEEFIKEYDVQ